MHPQATLQCLPVMFALLQMASAPVAAQGTTPVDPLGAAALDLAVERALEQTHQALAPKLDIWVDHSKWENAWVGASEHFEVRTTQGLETARTIAAEMETMLGHFQKVLGTDFVPVEPMRIYILPDRALYNTFGEDHGEAHSSFYGSFYAGTHPEQPVAVEWTDNTTLLRMQITHSVVHQYLAAAWPRTTGQRPLWIEEGLAAYFAYYWSPEWCVDAYLRAKEEGKVGPVTNMFRAAPPNWSQMADYHLLQLGVFFDYLLRLRPDTMSQPDAQGRMRGPFRDYLVSVLDGSNKGGDTFVALMDEPETLAADFANHQFR